MPGDRANECGGKMEPVAVTIDPKKGYVIIHKCTKCGELRRNKAAAEASVQPDDVDLIFDIMRRNAENGTGY